MVAEGGFLRFNDAKAPGDRSLPKDTVDEFELCSDIVFVALNV